MTTDRTSVEWPTLFLLVATYLVWAAATTWLAEFSLFLAVPVAALAIAQFSSLQHEALHGHPFRATWLNEILVSPALTVFVPYGRFRDTHLAHHHDPILTDPYDDPESNYLDPAVWAGLSRIQRAILRANNTLLGRVTLGPMIGTLDFLRGDLRLILGGDRPAIRAWMAHAVGLVPLALWLGWVATMPVWAYLLAVYVAYGILRVRTFLEHRAHEAARARTVIIEDRGPLALLFLNNNLHVVHHMHPSVPWYRLPAIYRANRERYLRRNDGYLYRSYWQVIRAHLLHPKDPVPHPLWTGTEAEVSTIKVKAA